jgi:hypothetical protein
LFGDEIVKDPTLLFVGRFRKSSLAKHFQALVLSEVGESQKIRSKVNAGIERA